MPISYTYNTVFIHIPKCAGTTIEKMLGTCTPEEFFDFKKVPVGNERMLLQHSTYLELKTALNIEWKNFYVFSVVRNPYSRLVSAYTYRKSIILNGSNSELGDFSSFVQYLNMEKNTRCNVFNRHLETQSSFLKDETGNISPIIKIFKTEDMKECMSNIKDITGVSFSNLYWSKRSPISEEYQKVYTPETKEIVYNFYKEDFDNFGYSPEL